MTARATIKIIHGDCMENEIPPKSISLIIADPPYYKVKGCFDWVWDSFDEYLADVEKWATECKRVLADNGTLFWWGHAKKIAYSQVILDRLFCLENSMVWWVVDRQTNKGVEMFRCFAPVTERLLMYSNGTEPEEWDQTGHERVMEEHIRPRSPFAKYLRDEFKRANVTNKEIAALFPSKTGGLTGCVSNWLKGFNVITEDQYLKIREYLNGEYLRKEYEYLRKEYEELRKEYEELRKEYEELRRPFNNTLKLTDVLRYSQESHLTKKYSHDTIKPMKLTRDLITTTTREGDRVWIPFVGSGTEIIAAYDVGCNAIGHEIDEGYHKAATARFKRHKSQGQLF